MKKIVIFKDEFFGKKKVRTVLRAIRPSASFIGFFKNGQVNDAEVKKLIRYLEPSSTGYYTA